MTERSSARPGPTRPGTWRLLRPLALAGVLAAGLSSAALADFQDGWRAYQEGDFATALGVWKPLAQAGEARAQFNLGVMFDQGRGVARDQENAILWWRKAAEQGMAQAMHNLANVYIAGEGAPPDYQEALTWLLQAAAKGLARSQYTLGKMHSNGLGVAQDEAKAVEWYRRAAEQGYDRAQYNMGKIYRDGSGGIEANAEQSAHWFQRAAEQGYAKAQSHLGSRYVRGEGVPKDEIQALTWMLLASEKGHPAAIENAKILRRRLSAGQIAEAEQAAAGWVPKGDR